MHGWQANKKRIYAQPVMIRAMPENAKPPAMRVDFYFFTCTKEFVGNGLCAIPFFRNDTQVVPYEMNIGFLFRFDRISLGAIGVKLVLAVALAEH